MTVTVVTTSRAIATLVLSFITLAIFVMGTSAAGAPVHPRALWMWQGDSLFDNDELDEFISFAQSPHGNADHRIKLVFLSFRGGYSPATWPALGRLIGRLHDAGITVHALTGDPQWALEHTMPIFHLQNVMRYNAQAERHRRFHGIQFDIEPYLIHDRWNSEEGFQQLRTGFLDLLDKMQLQRDVHDPDLQIGVAIPRWYDQAQYDYLNEDIQARSDYVAVMNYWNETERLVRDAAGELATGDALGKDVYVGVEVQRIEPATITFFGYTVAEMEAILTEAEAAYATHDAYRGTVIHYYEAYRAMTP